VSAAKRPRGTQEDGGSTHGRARKATGNGHDR
jgi:hypothetical protein